MTDPNPTPIPGTYLSTNRSVQASGEACVQACGEASGEAASARLSSGDTPTPDDVVEQAAQVLYESVRDRVTIRTGLPIPAWDEAPENGREDTRESARALSAAGLLRAPAPQPEGEREVLEFLFARYEAQRRRERPRCYGVSSDALAYYGVGSEPEPTGWDFPADPDDLSACERTYEMAPERIKPRMLPVLEKFRAKVAKDYPEVAAPSPADEPTEETL